MYALAISVGHNSSAIAIKDGKILGGFEEERFTRVKADSTFPIYAIRELKILYDLPADTVMCVSHWFPNGVLEYKSKYWDSSEILKLFPKTKIKSISNSDEFTHHDAHKLSAEVFAGSEFPENHHTLVIDGFGNFSEHISIYNKDKLYRRFYGYKYSLGLFYQYATAYCGMKMHNHEYKMLAYETHITELVSEFERNQIDIWIDAFSDDCISHMMGEPPDQTLDSLKDARTFIEKSLTAYLKEFATYVVDSYEELQTDKWAIKVMVSYFAQRHLENVVTFIHKSIKPKNLLLSGGVFFNVKLNHILVDMTKGKLCVTPLPGDQGAGLGVYQKYYSDLIWPDHLFWGPRRLNLAALTGVPGIILTRKFKMFSEIKQQLKDVGLVNIVRGNMEFGPRALCNTSTLAIPTDINAQMINQMNGRTNEMPFALVVTKKQLKELFRFTDKVHKSFEYMIITCTFNRGCQIGLEGGYHYYPYLKIWTCRPQVTEDPLMVDLLEEFGPLINTSWNFHGMPIVRSTEDILYTHNQERNLLFDIDFKTIVEL